MTPVVTVLLPVFNGEKYVRDAVQSILNQTLPELMLIVIDDGSTDKTAAILAQLAKADSRLRVISRPNTGYVTALNEGLALVTTPLVARMDADDISLPDRLAKQVGYMADHPDVVLLGAHVAQIDPAGRVIGPMKDVAFGHETITHALLRRGWPIVHPAVVMRTESVRQIGGYNPALCPNEDHDLFLRLGELGRLENLPDMLLHYRKHPGSESTLKQNKSVELITRIIVDACRRRGIPVPPEAAGTATPPTPIADQHRSWAWHAIKHRNVATARHYALSTLRRRPWSLDSWRLTYCAVRGR
jgi:glycosyltransferase involved in cell wall biosynthesis